MDTEDRSVLHGDRPAAVTSQAFPDRKELAATALQRTRMPMVITNATVKDHPIVLANQAFLNLTGYKADDVLGRNCRFLQGSGTSAAAVAEIRAGLREGREVNVELLNYKKDGTAFWNQLHLSPIHDDDGRVIYHFASQMDRTEYRRIEALEASEHRLLLEVDHRSNNALALVDSIVRLSRSDDAAQYAAAVQKRVRALARAHALLSRCGWHHIPLRETVSTQIEPYTSSRTVIEGDDVMLAPHAVQPLALFIHELAVNAASHGALSGDDGRVEVTWNSDPQAKLLTLAWREIGGPPRASTRRSGFGTVIGDATIRRQLNGSVERDWSDHGVRVTIEVPEVVAE
jgi:PAS domain S-box-containing protein